MDQNQKYEYKNVVARLKDKDLNKFASEGWELVSSKRRTLPFFLPPTDYVFKRKIKENQPIEIKPSQKKKSMRTYAWIFGIISLLIGVCSIFSSPIIGILFIIISTLLLPPVTTFVKKKYDISLSRNVRMATSAIILLIISGGILTTTSTSSQSNEVGVNTQNQSSIKTTSTPNTKTQPTQQTPLSDGQKIENVVSPLLQQDAILQASYDNNDSYILSDNADDPSDKQQDVQIAIDTGPVSDDKDYIMLTGALTESIFQKIFQIDPNFVWVNVGYFGPVTDQYGNATTSQLMGYGIDRMLYNKINWSGLTDMGDDGINFCGYLEKFNTLTGKSNVDDAGCDAFPSDLLNAIKEIRIENSSK